MRTAALAPETENVHDMYELLEYFIAKLDSRCSADETYTFLLDFIQVVAGDRHSPPPGCVFGINDENAQFEPRVIRGEDCLTKVFEDEFASQVDAGLVPWCISNRRLALGRSFIGNYGRYCMIIPLFTVKRILGLVFLYTSRAESDLSRASLKIINIACLQAGLYVDIMEMYGQLKNTQSRLIQSEKLAGIGQLAAGIAHEINNPVGFVSANTSTLGGYVQKLKELVNLYRARTEPSLLREKEKEMDIDYILGDIDELMSENEHGLRRIVDIVQAMKNFARNSPSVRREIADINESVKNALLMARNEIKYHADVEINLGDVSRIYCNSGEINQVLLNILINAAQAIESNKMETRGVIRVTTYEKKGCVVCEISDNGRGISADIQEKIFDPFFTTKPMGIGTGLGLSISYDIVVNKHKGDLLVSSIEGQGTSVILSLPISR